uniref:Hypothetical chloroplast RF1 n=1 Tax=Chlorogonium capillatum TaxID=71743 RepID=A0A0S2ICN8_9CHLO|nr:hypothetical chloroplast RF1 [Chlorogonium capillatum]
MIPVLSLVTSVKDYLEVVHKLIEYDSINMNYTEFGTLISYFLISVKTCVVDFFSFPFSQSNTWLNNIWSLPVIMPEISSAMISEISVLDGYFHNAFNFLETPVSYGEQNSLLYGLEKFTIGFLNSLFLFLPTSTAHIITLRRFVMQGLNAGYVSGLGTIAGNVLWLTSIIFGWRFFVIPWLSLDIFRYLLGFVLLIKYMWDSYNEQKTFGNGGLGISLSSGTMQGLDDIKIKYKIFLLNFLLALIEQTSIYPFISNISISPETSLLESFPADTYEKFIFIHFAYLLGITLGCFSLLHFTCWFWENPAFKIYMWVISSFKVSFLAPFYSKALNFTFLYLTMISAISSIPYYGLDYTITNPLGYVNDDRIIQDKLVLETSFLGGKASDRNTRRNRGRHGRRERWKRRIRKYRTFDASLYDQGIYDLFTIEDLNYGFDRFWLRRKLRNHRVRFRFFPGPWMRTFKKQLAKPRLESYTGPRSEFFRILFEQVYHPSFHAYSAREKKLYVPPVASVQKGVTEGQGLKGSAEFWKKNFSVYSRLDSTLSSKIPLEGSFSLLNSLSSSNLNKQRKQYSITENLIHENSTLRKFVRKLDTRLKTKILISSTGSPFLLNASSPFFSRQGEKVDKDMYPKIYSKQWKHLFSKIYHNDFSRKPGLDAGKGPLLLKQLDVLDNILQTSVNLSEFNESVPDAKRGLRPKAKKQNVRKNLSKKDFQILRYRSLLAYSNNANNYNYKYQNSSKIYAEPLSRSHASLISPFGTGAKDESVKIKNERNEKREGKHEEQGLETTQTSRNDQMFLLHPLKFYLQREAAFKRKLRYYSPSVFRKFSIENNAPYFRVMMRRYFYNYKPSLRWERTMKVASLRKARRKTTRIPRKLQFNSNYNSNYNSNSLVGPGLASSQKYMSGMQKRSSEGKDTNILLEKSFARASSPLPAFLPLPAFGGLEGGLGLGKDQRIQKNVENPSLLISSKRLQKPTFNYSVVSKKASRYRYQIYKDVLQHWYYSPFNRLLLKLDVDSFIRRQPNAHFLTAKEENLLHLRRFLISEHYNTLRWYTNMEHYRSMKTRLGGGNKSFASRAYNQQFSGTFKKIRHLFAITPSQGQENVVLKFDQPLYNEVQNNSKNPLLNRLIIHEELNNFNEGLTSGALEQAVVLSESGKASGDLLSQSQNIVREYLTNSRAVREEYIKKLLNENNYTKLTRFLYTGQKIRGIEPTTNQRLFNNQEKDALLTQNEKNLLYAPPLAVAFGDQASLGFGQQDKPQDSPLPAGGGLEGETLLTLPKAGLAEGGTLLTLPKAGLAKGGLDSESGKNIIKLRQFMTDNNLMEDLYVTYLKKWKRKMNDQEALKNYLSQRIEKREKRKQKKEKYLLNKLKRLENWFKNTTYTSSDTMPISGVQGQNRQVTSSFNPSSLLSSASSSNDVLTTGLQKAIFESMSTSLNVDTKVKTPYEKTFWKVLLLSKIKQSTNNTLNSGSSHYSKSNGKKDVLTYKDLSLRLNDLKNTQRITLSKDIQASTSILRDLLVHKLPYSEGREGRDKYLSPVHSFPSSLAKVPRSKIEGRTKKSLSIIKNKVLNLYKSFTKTIPSFARLQKMTNLLKPIKRKSLKNWRKKERASGKQKRSRKEFKMLNKKVEVKDFTSKLVSDIETNLTFLNSSPKGSLTKDTVGSLNPIRKKRDMQTSSNKNFVSNPISEVGSSSFGQADSGYKYFSFFKDHNNFIFLKNLLAFPPFASRESVTSSTHGKENSFKRKRSPQRRARIRRNRGVFRKRTLSDSLKKDIKKFYKDSQSTELSSLTYTDLYALYSPYSKSIISDKALPLTSLGSEPAKGLRIPLKQRKSKQRKERVWKQKRSKFSQKRRKYRKRKRYSLGKIRILSKQLKRVKNKIEIQNWWWKQFVPSIQASTDALWQIEKDKLIQQKLSELSSAEILERDFCLKSQFSNACNIKSSINNDVCCVDLQAKPKAALPVTPPLSNPNPEIYDRVTNPNPAFGGVTEAGKGKDEAWTQRNAEDGHYEMFNYNVLQIGNKDFKPLAVPEAIRIKDTIIKNQKSSYNAENAFMGASIQDGSEAQTTYIPESSLSSPLPFGLSSEATQAFGNDFGYTKPWNGSPTIEASNFDVVNKLYENLFITKNTKKEGSQTIALTLRDGLSSVENSFSGLKNNESFKPFMVPNTMLPFYAGWDESLRKFVVTNRMLSRQDAGYSTAVLSKEMKNLEFARFASNPPKGKAWVRNEGSEIEFSQAPVQGMNAATTLYWQIPFTTYDPDQFFALGMDGFSPIGWRKFLFRHSILKTWLNTIGSNTPVFNEGKNSLLASNFAEGGISENKEGKKVEKNNLLSSFSRNIDLQGTEGTQKSLIVKSKTSLINTLKTNKDTPFFKRSEKTFDAKNTSRRLKKRYRRVKKHPRTPVWFPSGPLLNQVLPVHYIYVFYKRARLPRDRYLKRRLSKSQRLFEINTKTINKSEGLNTFNNVVNGSAETVPYFNYDFTLRKRLKPKRKYHLKRDFYSSNVVIPRRFKFISTSPTAFYPRQSFGLETQSRHSGGDVDLIQSSAKTFVPKERIVKNSSSLRWRPLSSLKINKPIVELVKEQKFLRSKQRRGGKDASSKQQTNLRVKQLRRRVQRQVLRSVWRYRPRAGGFVWPGDYLKLELVKAPKLQLQITNNSTLPPGGLYAKEAGMTNSAEGRVRSEKRETQKLTAREATLFEEKGSKNDVINSTSLRSFAKGESKRKKKRTLVEWQIQPKKYLYEKHNIKVLKKKLEKAFRSDKQNQKIKELYYKF